MKVTGSLTTLATKALAESMDLNTMVAIVRNLIQNYDIHVQTGISDSLPIQRQIAAQQIIKDVKAKNLFLPIIEQLVIIHSKGYMGKKFPVKNLRQIIMQLREQGIIYDRENELFVEDPTVRRTRNWGALLEGREYLFSFLRLDIVGNSKLVREYSEEDIQDTYEDLRLMVSDAIDRRNGRIWSWEGDGGLIAFFFSNKHLYSTLSAMDIVHRLFLYNQLDCRLKSPLGVRLAVHSGIMEYTDNEEELKRTDIIKKIVDIEAKFTNPNSVTISDTVEPMLDKVLIDQFRPVDSGKHSKYYNYSLRWEQ